MKKVTLPLIIFSFTWVCLAAQTKAGRPDTLQHPKFTNTVTVTTSKYQWVPGEYTRLNPGLPLSVKERITDVVKLQNSRLSIPGLKSNHSLRIYVGRAYNRSAKEQMKAEVMKLHTCHSHPLTALDKNDICPKCARLQSIKDLEKRLKISG